MFRATQYVRVPSEHRQHLTDNQADKIKEYAEAHGVEIVRTYSDSGKSGYSVGGRTSLKKLIADIEAGNVDFNVILVCDVSRWGRFQEMDECAFMKTSAAGPGYSSRIAPSSLKMTAPQTPVLKSIKRAMAAEYSRQWPD